MAAITFNTARQKQRVRERLITLLVAFGEILDVFASNRMRRVAAAAEHARPRRIPEARSQSAKPQ